MKVCLVSRSNGREGAYAAAYRLYQGLEKMPVDASMIIGINDRDDPQMIEPNSYFDKAWHRLAPLIDMFPQKLLYKQRKLTPYSLQWLPDRISSQLQKSKADIINLHWITAGFMQIETLRKIQKPIVWTLHDMWPFTGGCHYNNECKHYQQACGKCPQLNSEHSGDLSHWVWKRKQKNWSSLNLTLVSPSYWLADCVKQSSLFKDFPIHVIHNGLDPQVYQPINKQFARNLLNLPQDKKLILFGSINPHGDQRKGIRLLIPALEKLQIDAHSQQIELAIFGSPSSENLKNLKMKAYTLGKLQDDLSLAIVYSAADVFVAPSLEDNLPNTIMEALACGVPCVAFKTGGIPDMIDHQVNGYLAQPFEGTDLAQGILWVLDNSERWCQLSQAARQKVEQEFTLEKQAQQYRSLFQNLI